MQALGARPISPAAIRECREKGEVVNIVVRACALDTRARLWKKSKDGGVLTGWCTFHDHGRCACDEVTA